MNTNHHTKDFEKSSVWPQLWTIITIPYNSFYSGCKLFKPFKPIVFLELLIHSLATLTLWINIQETLGSPWFKSYINHYY